MPVPIPTPIYRIVHIDNLRTLVERGGLFAPTTQPQDGRPYRVIHNAEIQDVRKKRRIPCGPGGVIHDYVSFYFGPRSPMLLQLHTGQVSGYRETQQPIIYLLSSFQRVLASGARFVFSDGQGIAAYTSWFDDPRYLSRVDWDTVYAKWWSDTLEDMDRQRRKQAEFLIHGFCPWEMIEQIAVVNRQMKQSVEGILGEVASAAPDVVVRSDWYY